MCLSTPSHQMSAVFLLGDLRRESGIQFRICSIHRSLIEEDTLQHIFRPIQGQCLCNSVLINPGCKLYYSSATLTSSQPKGYSLRSKSPGLPTVSQTYPLATQHQLCSAYNYPSISPTPPVSRHPQTSCTDYLHARAR